MELRDEVIQVLKGPEVSSIKFTFRSILGTPVEVNYTTFHRVIEAIGDGRIRVDPNVPEGLGGQYVWQPENGGLLHARPAGNDMPIKAIYIHEAVHASIDLTRSTISEVDNEVAGFLAQILYLQRNSYPFTLAISRQPHLMRLRESLLRATGSRDSRTGFIEETQIRPVRQRISENPHYSYVLSRRCLNGESNCFRVITPHNG